ncbi:HipA domain-containing protein [Isoptericola sp. 178]|uniref:HipA domain-containing protein n=1 Tax=Isoptericola sp. 178 TaxID=3064651 RepID=UPI002712242A|nr:HipA domain-containing protein [Isoptericola sp. 178]MDO8144523.1 HipA domain-containing protein [Isoptericola sp. 178]
MARTNHLAVLLEGRHVAELNRTRSGILRLTYRPEARRPGVTPLSLSLPPSEATHVGAPVEQFLAGLVPERTGALRSIARRHRVDPDDILDVLTAIGKDCAGAVQFCRESEIDDTIRRTGRLEECTAGDIEVRLDEMDTNEDAAWTMPGEHWSLGGTQQKLALRREAGRWFVAHDAEPTTHIVKPGIRRMRAQALVEHVSMRAAQHLGVDVAATEFTSFRSQDAVVVTRFDRHRSPSGDVTRLHQEDLCQAMGNPEKYEEYGGPSSHAIVQFLRDASATAAAARRNVDRFVDGLIYNTVVAAPDAHARNYAVLLQGDDVRLAPLFDVATGLAYDMPAGSDRVLSMSIGDSFDADAVDDGRWARWAEAAGLDASTVLGRVGEMQQDAPAAFAAALDEIDDVEGHVAQLKARLLPALEARRH